ncbi:MAG: hypothetical protein JWN44_1831 [Myxococcales bacterium]|nr:hypothetical protein [Myxococcales bacterium]
MDDARLWPLIAIGLGGLLLGIWPLVWMALRAGRRMGGRDQIPVGAGRYLSALLSSILFLAIGLCALSLMVMLQGWRAFTKKTHVAELQCIELGAHKLRVYLVPIDNDGERQATEVYDVDGDQWQVGGDVLRFRSFMTALGVQPVFRLTRIEGHWNAAADANTHTGTAFDRAPPSSAWMGLYRGADKAPIKWLVDGAHGQAVSQLPDRRAVYDIYVTPNGYIVDKRSL